MIPSDPTRSSTAAPREESDFGEWLGNLYDGRAIIAWTTGLFLLLGLFIVWNRPPSYQVEALLQVQPKKPGSADPSFTKMESLFAAPADAQAEIEILKSNQVLGRTVEVLKLDLEAEPALIPVIGPALMRGNPEAPRIEVESLEVPDLLRGQKFRVTALGGDAFRWEAMRPGLFASKGVFMGNGRVGEPLSGSFAGEAATLTVRALYGKPGQVFLVSRLALLDVINGMRKDFEATEKGKLTNVVGLAYRDENPAKAAKVLNTILEQYLRLAVERKGGEIAKAKAVLEAKVPEMKAKVDAAEIRLSQYRASTGSVDITREADIALQQSASLYTQISSLKQKKEDLLRTYKETSDVVSTLNQQIEKLKAEAALIDRKVRALPGIQQEVVRLTRDVQINTDLYTALLNNIQQLQVARDSDVSNVAVVDVATPAVAPEGPKKSMQVGLFVFIGALSGVGLTMLRQAMRQGVEDPHLIEAKLGIPVIVTIPHSRVQKEYKSGSPGGKDPAGLLAVLNPNDLAVESLRGLRTSLRFAMKDAVNRVVMLTGPSPGIGKSFISSNLAAVLAQAGARVLVVDADLRRGNLHRYFGLKSRDEGLSQVLAGLREWRDMVFATDVRRLDLMPSGAIPANPSELLLEPRLAEFVSEVSGIYDYVLLDAPPALPVTDAAILGPLAGTVLMVARYGQHSLNELRACQRKLEDHGVRVQGCIFNDLQKSGLANAHGGYKHAYHYAYRD